MTRDPWCPRSLVWVVALACVGSGSLAAGCAAGDGSTPSRTDSGPGEVDAATASDGAVQRDTSAPRDADTRDSEAAPLDAGADAEESCGAPPLSLTPDQLPRCSAATSACVDGCSTGACQMACFDADETPPITVEGRDIDCLGCLNVQTTDCAVTGGCQEEWDAFRCCEAACGDLACAGQCQTTHRSALNTCYQMFARDCQGALMECFPLE